MQSQAATIHHFEALLQGILSKVQVFRNQIVETESDFWNFFKAFLTAEEVRFTETPNLISISQSDSSLKKPVVVLKFAVSCGQTKSDDIINFITVAGLIYFLKKEAASLNVAPRILIEKIVPGTKFNWNIEPGNSIVSILAIDNNILVDEGCIAFKEGTLIPAEYNFQVKLFKNEILKSGGDVITIAGHVVTSLSQIATRKLDPMHLSHVKFDDVKVNTLNDTKEIAIFGDVCAVHDDSANSMRAIMQDTIEAIAKSNDCLFEFVYTKKESVFENNPERCRHLKNCAIEILGKNRIQKLEFLNKDYKKYRALFKKVPAVLMHISGLDTSNQLNLIPTLHLAKIDKISQLTTKVICWTLLNY